MPWLAAIAVCSLALGAGFALGISPIFLATATVYRLNSRQIAKLRAQLAGLSREQASAILHRMEGVTEARLQSRDTLPGDPGRIHVLLVS